jgi:hypothetical protein
MGLRSHDIPFEHHGNWATALYSTSMTAERGQVVALQVVNCDDACGRFAPNAPITCGSRRTLTIQ